MKKMLLMMACVLTVGFAFQSCKSKDQKIQDNVQNVISTDYRTVSSTVRDGVVTLTGTVESQQTRSAAESAARSVKDVKSVVNNIMVNSASNQNMQNMQNMQQNQNNMYADDSAMRSTIMTKLNNGGYRDVRVDVNNGEVTLSGEANRADLSRVMQIANESNPRRVTNNINLR